MFGRRREDRNQAPTRYATKSDFCRIFEQDVNRLYLLSFVLTGDRSIAEQCFVGGLHIAQEGNHVFKEWAESWARRAIIQNAIRMVRPRKIIDKTLPGAPSSTGDVLIKHDEIGAIIDLPAFERFAFVMSVLERYSDQECSFLLNCTAKDVALARTRALQRLGEFANRRNPVSISSSQKAGRDDSESSPQLTMAPGLAASA